MLADLLKRVKNIEAQPLPLPLSGAARTVSKGEERDAGLEKLLSDSDALSLLAIKLAAAQRPQFSDALSLSARHASRRALRALLSMRRRNLRNHTLSP